MKKLNNAVKFSDRIQNSFTSDQKLINYTLKIFNTFSINNFSKLRKEKKNRKRTNTFFFNIENRRFDGQLLVVTCHFLHSEKRKKTKIIFELVRKH